VDFKFTEKEETLRREIREFAQKELPVDWFCLPVEEQMEYEPVFSKKLAEKGWLTMAWPKEYGGWGASIMEQVVYNEEVAYWGIPGSMMGVSGVSWIGLSLLLFGNEEQKKKYLPLISSGGPDGVWCTLYSEPDAGCDLANLQTRAVKEGDHYVVNGQKTWTSAAHVARWGWLLARTDPNAPKKHHGISLFIVDMKSTGVIINPLFSIAGKRVFNEVFFDNVRIPVSNLVGEENKGWHYVMSSLAEERSSTGNFIMVSKRVLEELINYVKEEMGGESLSRDPIIRQKLANIAIEIEIARFLNYRLVWEMSKNILSPNTASEVKLVNDELMEHVAITGMQILGLYSRLEEGSKRVKLRGMVESLYLLFLGIRSAAGTDEVQKNIMGQIGLGLPRSY
jgi:alkylation response protein AidB-like acyl-CoA dehydrogenase